MTRPTKHEITVGLDALRHDGELWKQESGQLQAAAAKAEAMRLTRIEMGVFQLIVGPYHTMVDHVVTWCHEGQQRLSEVGDTLKRAAQVYENEDNQQAHAIRNLY